MWDTIIGHEAEKVFLRNMLTGQRKTPSLLFYGPEGIGKRKMARAFAQSFLCLENPLVPCTCRSCQAMENDSHPDFIEVEPGGKSRTIGVDAIHELIAKAAFGPVLSPYKVCLIDKAHTLREEAQNSLLKLLEEPPEYWLFLLVADQVEQLLPTIRSRVIGLRFDPLTEGETEQVLASIRLGENDRPESLADADGSGNCPSWPIWQEGRREKPWNGSGWMSWSSGKRSWTFWNNRAGKICWSIRPGCPGCSGMTGRKAW